MTRDQVFNMRLGADIRQRRGDQTQGELARKVGITQASLSNYELGKRDIPLVTAYRIAQELDLSLDALLARAAS